MTIMPSSSVWRTSDGVELILRKDALTKEIRRKLDGYLPDVRAPELLIIVKKVSKNEYICVKA